MKFTVDAVPITADPDTIRTLIETVDVVPLLVAVAHRTGRLDLLSDDVRPDPARNLEPDGGLTAEQVATGRDRIAEALHAHAAAGSPPAPEPSPEALRHLIAFVVGDAVETNLFTILVEELALDDSDPRAPLWSVADDEVDFPVAVIGAGMSGLLMSHRLAQAGVDHVVFDKNPSVGGTWFENTYPGCRVDVPNHLYSYSFAQTGDWPGFYSTQENLLEYFRTVARHHGIEPRIQLGTEVVKAAFDDQRQCWTVTTRGPDGTEAQGEFAAVVSAVGQLNRPSFPDIVGRESFQGLSFHSARWPEDLDLSGQRVAVIGTGASAAQFIPAVAEAADHTIVFQRSAPWLVPSETYHDDLDEGHRWVLRHLNDFKRWDRLWLFWRLHEGLLPMAEVDPDWPHQDRSVSADNDLVRELLSAYHQVVFPDPDIYAKTLPDYPPVAKRVVRDNGLLGRTYQRPDVELNTDGIAEITATGVTGTDGTHHEVDVIIYGTGFTASEFLVPMEVSGVAGIDLHQRWKGDARAYLGITVPGFPNLFLMYGPNTNIVINGSIIYFSECEAHYIGEALRMLIESGHRSMECRTEVHDAYNDRIDAKNRQMAWGAAEVNSWYKSASGRVAQNWPFSLLEFWEQTRTVDPDDYIWRRLDKVGAGEHTA